MPLKADFPFARIFVSTSVIAWADESARSVPMTTDTARGLLHLPSEIALQPLHWAAARCISAASAIRSPARQRQRCGRQAYGQENHAPVYLSQGEDGSRGTAALQVPGCELQLLHCRDLRGLWFDHLQDRRPSFPKAIRGRTSLLSDL